MTVCLEKEKRNELVEGFNSINAIYSDVESKSGRSLGRYLDMRKVFGNPYVRGSVLGHTKTHMSYDTDLIVSNGVGGLPYASMMALEMRMHMATVRDSQKAYGIKNKIEGDIPKNAKVVIMDDVMSSGGTIRKCIETITEKTDAEILEIFVVLDRSDEFEDWKVNKRKIDKIPVKSLLSYEDLYSVNL